MSNKRALLFLPLFLTSFLLVFTPFQASANKSFVCPDSKTQYRGITCCLESDFDLSLCEKLIDELPQNMLKSVEHVQSEYASGRYDLGAVPNCHWGALEYHNLLEQTPQPISEFDLSDVLKIQAMPVEPTSLQKGDFILFNFVGTRRIQVVENFVPVWLKYPEVRLDHTAIYLGHDLVFQKENQGTDIFSISRIQSAAKTYLKIGKGSDPKLTPEEIQFEFFRKGTD